jgi:protoporphyrinogen oxidase
MRTALIIGAGPAGLTAAYELLQQTDIVPIILEASYETGGLSRTVQYKGNRMDIGGHRFFSKSQRVMDWWQQILPIEAQANPITIQYHNRQTVVTPLAPTGSDPDAVLLVRNRLSRIYFLRKFFGYPLSLNITTIRNLGMVRLARIGFSYMRAQCFPRRPEVTLEDFFINRFGRELYLTFFKDYTEKVWGVPTSQISAAWGAQRIKGLSLLKTLRHALFRKKNKAKAVDAQQTETSLIEKFLYPKFGPGQLWERVAAQILAKGGQIHYGQLVIGMDNRDGRIHRVTAKAVNDDARTTYTPDFVISTMPVKDLVQSFCHPVPASVKAVSEALVYRDFITVGLLVKRLAIQNADGSAVKDNWIYIQEQSVKLGRLQVFNNWSPSMVADPGNTWLGLEYFCNEGDTLWTMTDEAMLRFAAKELAAIGIIAETDVLDGTVIRVPKTYPSYIGAYTRFEVVREHLDTYPNLFLAGRNGMHKYNNQDHSMLTAMQVVTHIRDGITDKSAIWAINTEEDYHEA